MYGEREEVTLLYYWAYWQIIGGGWYRLRLSTSKDRLSLDFERSH